MKLTAIPLRYGRPIVLAVVVATYMLLSAASSARAALPSSDGPWTSFGTNGITTHDDYRADQRQFWDIEYQPDGKLVVLLWRDGQADESIYVRRFEADGTLDTAFGTGGTAEVGYLAGTTTDPREMLVQRDGRIVVLGKQNGAFGGRDIIARLNTDGGIDTTFGTGGIIELDGCTNYEYVQQVVERPGGGLLVTRLDDATCNQATDPGSSATSDAWVHALLPDGSPDPSFGGGTGQALVLVGASSPPSQALPVAIDIFPDGGIVVGISFEGAVSAPGAVVRLDASGALVPSFGVAGVVTLDSLTTLGNAVVGGVFARNDGSVVATYVADTTGNTATALDPAGVPIPSFGVAGVSAGDPGSEVWFTQNESVESIRDEFGRITQCGMTISIEGGAVLTYVNSVTRWLPDGTIEERLREPINVPVSGSAYKACAAGVDGRIAFAGVGMPDDVIVAQRYARYDFVPPVVAVVESTVGVSTTYTVTASDASSGLEDVDGAYSFDGGVTWQAASRATLPALQPGDADRVVRVRDRAGTFADRTFVAPTAPAVGGGGSSLPPAPTPASPASSPAAPSPLVVPSVLGSGSATYDAVSFAAQVLDPAGERGPYRYSFDGGVSWQSASTVTVSGLGRKVTRTVSIVVEASDGARSAAVVVSQTTRDNGVPAVNVGVTGTTTTRGHVVKPVPKVLTGGELEVVARSEWGGIGEISATFRGGSVPVVDGRIDVTRMREGSGTLTVRATDVDGDVGSFSRQLRVDRTAPTLKSVTGTYVIGPTVRLRASDFGSGVVSPRITVKLESRTGAMTVKAKVRDRAGNLQKRGVTVNRRIALRDQNLNRDLKMTSRDGSDYAPVKGGSHGAFRFLDYVQPYYSQLEYQDPYVKEAQWRLAKLGCLKPGSFQPGRLDMSTIRAVQAYQVIKGFEVLGTVGPRTRHALDLDLLRGLPARTCR